MNIHTVLHSLEQSWKWNLAPCMTIVPRQTGGSFTFMMIPGSVAEPYPKDFSHDQLRSFSELLPFSLVLLPAGLCRSTERNPRSVPGARAPAVASRWLPQNPHPGPQRALGAIVTAEEGTDHVCV